MNVMLLGYLGMVLTTTERQSTLVFCGYKLYDVDTPFSSGLTAVVNVAREEVECKNSEYNIINAVRVPVNNSNQPCFIQKDFEWNKVNLPWYSVASADSNAVLPASKTITLTTMYKGMVTAIDSNCGVAILNGQQAVSLVTELHASISNFAVLDGKPQVGVVYNKNSFGEPIKKNMQYYALMRCVEQFKLMTYFKNLVEQNKAVTMSGELGNMLTQRMIEAANVGKALQKNEAIDFNRLRNFTAITDDYISVCNKNLGDLYTRLHGNQVSANNTAEKSQNSAVSSQPVEPTKTAATAPAVKPVENKSVAPAVTDTQSQKSDIQLVAENPATAAVQKSMPSPEAVPTATQENVVAPETMPVDTQRTPQAGSAVEPTAKYVLNKLVSFKDVDDDSDIEPVADLNGTEYGGQAVLSYAYTAGGAVAGGIAERDIEREKTPAAMRIMGKYLGQDRICALYNSRSALFEYMLSLSDRFLPGSQAFWLRTEGCFFTGGELDIFNTAMELAKLVESETIRDINGNTYEVLREFCPNKLEVSGKYYPDERPFSVIVGELRSPAGHSLSYTTLDFHRNGATMQTRNIQQLKPLIDNKVIIGATIENGRIKYVSRFIDETAKEYDECPVYRTGITIQNVNMPIAVHKQSEKPTYATYGRRDQFGNIKILRDDEIDDGYISSLTTLDLEYIYNWLNINVFATAAGGCAPSIRVFGIDVDDSTGNSTECMYVFYKMSEANSKSVFDMSSTNTGEVSKRIGGSTYIIRPVAVGVNLNNLCNAHKNSKCRGDIMYTSFYSAFILMMLYVSGYNIPTWLKDYTASTRLVGKEFPDFGKTNKADMISLYMNCMRRLQSTLGTAVPNTTADFATATLTLGHRSAGYIRGTYATGELQGRSVAPLNSKSEIFYYPKKSENSIDKRLQLSADLFRVADLSLKRVKEVLAIFAMHSTSKKACTLKANEEVLGDWFKDHSIFSTKDFGVGSLAPATILQQRAIYVTKLEQRTHKAMWEGFLEDGYKLTGADIVDFADKISTTKNLDSYQSLSSIPSDLTKNICYDSSVGGTSLLSKSVLVHDIVTEQQAGYGLWTALLRSGGAFINVLIKLCRQYRDYKVLTGIVPLIFANYDVVNEFRLTGDYYLTLSEAEDYVQVFMKRWLANFVLARAVYNANLATIPQELLNLYNSAHISYNASPAELLAIPEIAESLREDAKFNIDFLIHSDTVDYAQLFKLLVGVSILQYYPTCSKVGYERYNAYDAGIAAFFLRYKYTYDGNLYNYDSDGFSTYHLFESMQRIWVILGLKYGDFAGVWANDKVRNYNSLSVNLVISLCDLFERLRIMPVDMSILSKTDLYLSFFGRIGQLTFVLLTFSECNVNKLPAEFWALLSKPSLQGLSALESKYHDMFVTLGRVIP